MGCWYHGSHGEDSQVINDLEGCAMECLRTDKAPGGWTLSDFLDGTVSDMHGHIANTVAAFWPLPCTPTTPPIVPGS